MDNVELLKTIGEIVSKNCGGHCTNCDLFKTNAKCGKNLCDALYFKDSAEEVIEICERWRKDHPVKTYADVFFEQFPNAKRFYNDHRVPDTRFNAIYGGNYVGVNEDIELWLQSYPEEK